MKIGKKMTGIAFLGTAVLSVTVPALAQADWNGKVYDVKAHAEISLSEMAEHLSKAQNVVLGEKHYTPAVQQGEATLIGATVQAAGRQKEFTTAWEFLNASSQITTDLLFGQFVAGKITAQDFLKTTQGASAPSDSYAPVLEITKKLGGKLLGVNITREDKAPVVQGGIAAANPKVVPPGFEMGGKDYFARFAVAMQGHATEGEIANYFAAQCLTDDVMAYNLIQKSNSPLKFLIAGDFHTDYFDAAVARLKKRAPNQDTMVIHFVDASEGPASDILATASDPKYGDIADYLYVVNEPVQQP